MEVMVGDDVLFHSGTFLPGCFKPVTSRTPLLYIQYLDYGLQSGHLLLLGDVFIRRLMMKDVESIEYAFRVVQALEETK